MSARGWRYASAALAVAACVLCAWALMRDGTARRAGKAEITLAEGGAQERDERGGAASTPASAIVLETSRDAIGVPSQTFVHTAQKTIVPAGTTPVRQGTYGQAGGIEPYYDLAATRRMTGRERARDHEIMSRRTEERYGRSESLPKRMQAETATAELERRDKSYMRSTSAE